MMFHWVSKKQRCRLNTAQQIFCSWMMQITLFFFCVWSKREKRVSILLLSFYCSRFVVVLYYFFSFFKKKIPFVFFSLADLLCYRYSFFFHFVLFCTYQFFSSPLSFSCFQLHFLVLISRFFLCSASNFSFVLRPTNQISQNKKNRFFFFKYTDLWFLTN